MIGAPRLIDGAVLAGWHELIVTKKPQRPTRELLAEAVHGAVGHAGLELSDIDGFAVGGFTLGPDHAVDLAARCGLRVGWLAPQDPGGAGALNAVLRAASAVSAGEATAVVCAAADNTDPVSLRALNAGFSTAFEQTLDPVGAASASVVFAFIAREHMRQTGSTRYDFGEIAVRQRANGAANPRAMFRSSMSMNDYLGATPVVEPLHLYDCVLPGSGAAAVVVTTANRPTGGARVRLNAGFTCHGADRGDGRFGWSSRATALYEVSGIGPGELSTLELYDDYPLMVAIQLEELGFARRGELDEFLTDDVIGVTSQLPVNTGGGMLSCGQAGGAGGYLPLIQAARQISGQAGQTQVVGARSSLVTGLGMIDQYGPQSVGALILDDATTGPRS